MWIQCMRFLLGGGGGVGEGGGSGWKNKYSTFLLKAVVRNALAYFSFSEEWVWEIHTLITVFVWLGPLYFYRVMVPCAAFFNDHNWHWASSLIGFARFPLKFGGNLIQWSIWGTVSERLGGTDLERRERVVNWGLRPGGGGLGVGPSNIITLCSVWIA